MSIQRLSNAGQSGFRYKSLIAGITPVASVPVIGTATAVTFSTASVTFTAPGAYAGSTYTATSSPGGFTGTSASSPITVSGLSGDTAYTFTVTATNATGTSGPSTASNSITTPAEFTPESGYDALATVTLASSASTVTFAGIPTGYKHLQIRAIARTDRNVSDGDFYSLRFNGDSGANYTAGHQLYGNGASSTSYFNGASSNQIYIERIPALNSTASVFGGMVLDILDYQNSSKNKTTRALLGFDNNSSNPVGQIHLASGAWMSTSSITSMTFTSGTSSNFVANSQFVLYGVK
jgi:hypothetical protein